jgi:hypothetical protein
MEWLTDWIYKGFVDMLHSFPQLILAGSVIAVIVTVVRMATGKGE